MKTTYTFKCTDGTACGGKGTFAATTPWSGLTKAQLETIANDGFVELTPLQVTQNNLPLDDEDKAALAQVGVLHLEYGLGATSCPACGSDG